MSGPSAADLRAFKVGAVLAIAASAVMFATLTGIVDRRPAAIAICALVAATVAVCLTQWLRGPRLQRERVPVIAPCLLAIAPLAVALGELVGRSAALVVSILGALAASAMFGVVRRG